MKNKILTIIGWVELIATIVALIALFMGYDLTKWLLLYAIISLYIHKLIVAKAADATKTLWVDCHFMIGILIDRVNMIEKDRSKLN